MVKLEKSTYWLKLSEFVSKNSWRFSCSFMCSNIKMLILHVSASKSKPKRRSVGWNFFFFGDFLVNSEWKASGSNQNCLRSYLSNSHSKWNACVMCAGGEERERRSAVTQSLHQFCAAALSLKILWSDLETSCRCLLKWSVWVFWFFLLLFWFFFLLE